MAETMEQYMIKTRADYGSGVARPKIEDNDNFELNGQFLKELRTNTFSGSDNKDANEHIKKVLEIIDLFHIPNITIDQILDSRDAIPSKTAADAKVAIQEMAEYSQKYHNGTSVEKRSQSMEDTLSKFMSESTKRHEENSNLIKEIQASTDAAIRNQGASIKTLEIQIGQMCKLIHARYAVSTRQNVGIKRLLDDLRVTAAKLMLLVYKLLLLVLKVNAASTKVTTAQRLRLLKEFLLSEKG
ncbi:hypothetical protein Tco_0178052 [Tanacetum coccineum]